MESILSNLFVSDEFLKRKASLRVVFQQPDAILRICEIIVTSEKPEIRQYAAVLLGKHIDNLDTWQAVSLEQQAHIKLCTLKVILVETQESVRKAIAQTICVLAKHEFDKNDEWRRGVLKIILVFTLSDDAQKSELGSSLFKILTETATHELIIPHIWPICETLSAAMISAAESGNMVTPVMLNILLGMSNLVPFVLGHNSAKAFYQKSIPYVIKTIERFAQQDPGNFIEAFEILEIMALCTPKLLTPHLDTLIEFSLNTARNNLFQTQVRLHVVTFIGELVKFNKEKILKNKLLERIVGGVFILMGTHSEDGESDEDDYFTDNEYLGARINATHTMGLLALHVPPQKLIPQLLEYIKLAVENPDPNQKKAAQLCLAVIANGCSKASCAKYFNLEYMFNCIKTGLVDPLPLVRKAAVFALDKFSKHHQTDISKFAEEILPVWLELLDQLCHQIRSGVSVINIDRTFYSLEPYIENLEDDILPHLPVLMERIFEILLPENKVDLRKFGMSAVTCVAKAAKTQMLPYFQKICEILKVYFLQSDNEDIVEIQLNAIDTLAALTRTIGKENFMPLTDDIITLALIRLKNARDPLLRSGLYNLFLALAKVGYAKIAPVLKEIVEPMLNSLKSTDNILPEDIDVENSDDEDDDVDDDDEDEDGDDEDGDDENGDDEDGDDEDGDDEDGDDEDGDDEDDDDEVEDDDDENDDDEDDDDENDDDEDDDEEDDNDEDDDNEDDDNEEDDDEEDDDEDADDEEDDDEEDDDEEDDDDDEEDEYGKEEKAGALRGLKHFAEFSGQEFVPYLSTCFEYIYKQLDNSHADMRILALEALVQFFTLLNQNNDDADVQNKVAVFVPKVAEIIENDYFFKVVIAALDSYGMLLKELKQKVIFTEKLKTTIFKCIEKVLTSKVSCQLNDDQGDEDEQEESENDKALIKAAGDLLPKFGGALSPDEFSTYFRKIVLILLGKMEHSLTQRSFAYAALSACFQPLQNRSGEWFEMFLPGYLQGLIDEFSQVRQNCAYGLGELVLHSGEVAYAKFPMVLSALSAAVAQEKHPKTLDYICGAFARLIIANFKIIPLEQVLPVFVQKLPLREYFDENLTIFKCFTTLWEQQPESLWVVLDGVIMVGMHVLLKNQYKGRKPRSVILNLLQDIRLRFSDRFNQVVNRDPEIEKFVQTW